MSSETLRNMLVKLEPRNVVCCFVCAGTRADYPLYSKPYGDQPFFPFLEHHNPPEGAENITLDGRVLVCSLCYTFLTQQWNSYERSKTPHSKRIYWLKRLDNGPFAGMEINQQQDYESLFDSSHCPIETDLQPKQRPNHNSHTPTPEMKKFPDRTESRDSSASSSICEKQDVPKGLISNALDLTMTSQSPSLSSSTVTSPSSELESCYICGNPSPNFINVYAKPISNCPFFPSLLFHAKPLNAKPMDDTGKLHSCENCHKCLLLQWDFYQRQNVPHSERSYNFKLNSTVPKQEHSVTETFVCFACGMSGHITTKRELDCYPSKPGDVYFSFLTQIAPAPGAEPLVNGKASVCSICYKSLFRQLRVFELSSVPEERRKYKIQNDSLNEDFSVLRQHLKGNAAHQNPMPKAMCFLCDKGTDTVFPISSIPNHHMYFPFIRTLPKALNSELFTADGVVMVCQECYTSLKFQWETFENAKIPINQRQYRIASSKAEQTKKVSVSQNSEHELHAVNVPKKRTFQTDACCLCIRPLTSNTVHVIDTLPRHDTMYFPFVRSYLKAEAHSQIDQHGRVMVCTTCYSLLKNQWDLFESASVPHSQRQYRFFMPTADRAPKLEPSDNSYPTSALHVQVPSPDLKPDLGQSVVNPEPLLTTANTFIVNNAISSTASANCNTQVSDGKILIQKAFADEGLTRSIVGPLDASLGRPLLVSAVCFICAEHSTSTPMYYVHSKSIDSGPVFPFISKRPMPEGAEKLTHDGSALVCLFCYHTLVSQYLAYDMSPYPEDKNCWQRKYNTHNYVCYICGITTYRQRACSISVHDFPFLSEHIRPPGSLTMLQGECVVTCLTCFESLTSQWKDFERMKVPVTMRKYNWIVYPPPVKDEKNRSQKGSSGHDLAACTSDENVIEHRSEAEDSGGLSHGTKPPPHVPVQTLYGSKPSSRAIAASNAHSTSSHAAGSVFPPFEDAANSTNALSATRTSSFAAALRKLAKQAVDPVAERDISPICSPSPGQQLNKAHIQSSSYGNSNHGIQNLSPASNAASYELDKRKGLDFGRYSGSAVNSGRGADPAVFKSEYGKHSHEDQRHDSDTKRSPLFVPLPQFGSRDEHGSLSHGFQPYRNTDEAPSSQSRDQSPSSTTGGYSSYHRQLYATPSSSSSSQSYRLDESLYFERFGLLRPPAVSFPSSSLPFSSMPFYPGNRYPSGLLSQSPTSSGQTATGVKRERPDDMLRESEFVRAREKHLAQEAERTNLHMRERAYREMEGESSEEKVRRIFSPLSLQINSRTGSPMHDSGRLDPGSYNNSHDLLMRKHSPTSSSAPLNLVKQSTTSSTPAFPDNIGKWKQRQQQQQQQQYPSNTPGYGNAPFGKNGYESSFEQKFHSHPPPLVSEVKQESHSSRNAQKPDDLSGRTTISYQAKSLSPYSTRDYAQRSAPEDILPGRPSATAHLNGIPPQEAYEHRSIYGSQFPLRDGANRGMPEEWAKTKIHAKNGTIPVLEAWNSRMNVPHARDDRSQQQQQQHEEVSRSYEDSQFALRDASITRALLQNQITPSVIERYVNAVEEPLLVSRLDRRETKLRKERTDSNNPNCELSDSESDSEFQMKLKEFTIITKGPPCKFKKLGFFKSVGLTTRPKKQYLEWKKYMKRRKILREKSCSPVEMGDNKKLSMFENDHLAELSKRLCVEDNSETKRAFLNVLGLEKVCQDIILPASAIKSEKTEESVRTDACVVSESSGNENVEYNYKKRRSFLCRMHTSNANESSTSNDRVNGSESSDKSDSGYTETRTLPFSQIVSKAISASMPPLIPSEQAQNSGKAIVSSQDPRAKFLDRSFAQEFHESVLQATQMQLVRKKGSVTSEGAPVGNEMPQRLHTENRLPFSWPGIEAIMESYENHIAEQSVEKDFLCDRLQFLKSKNEELNNMVACLGQKSTDLVHRNGCLETEAASFQASLDKIKRLFQTFR